MNFKQTWKIVCQKLFYTHYRTSAYAMQHIYAERLPNVRRARFWSAVKSECEIWLAEDCQWRQVFAHCILIVKWCNVAPDCSWQSLWWPTTVTAKPKTSRQNQKRHGKTENLTAKPKTSRQKQNTSRQKQNTSRQNKILHSKNKIALVLTWVFAFEVRYLVFAVKYLVLPWDLWFCREGFGFVVRCFVFAVRFLVLPWQLWATVQSRLKLVIWSCGPLKHYLKNITQVHQINNKLKWS